MPRRRLRSGVSTSKRRAVSEASCESRSASAIARGGQDARHQSEGKRIAGADINGLMIKFPEEQF